MQWLSRTPLGVCASVVLCSACDPNRSFTAPTASGVAATTGADAFLFPFNRPPLAYVANPILNAVEVFPANANGNVAPATTIAGPNTGMSQPISVAFDGSGKISVLQVLNSTVTVYPSGASGNVSPVATITVPARTFTMTVDGRGTVYVGGESTISVYAPGANGNVAPERTIQGAAPNPIISAGGMAVDDEDNLYVANLFPGDNSAPVLIFGPDANGVTPAGTITGSRTDLVNVDSLPATSRGVALDGAGKLYVGVGAPLPDGGLLAQIVIFPAAARGNATPLEIIGGSNTQLNELGGLTIAAATPDPFQFIGNVYVGTGGSILMFSGGTPRRSYCFRPRPCAPPQDNVAPSAVIEGSGTGLPSTNAVRIDYPPRIRALAR
jgi:hypothetical protein